MEPVEYSINNAGSEIELTSRPHVGDRLSFMKKKGLKGIRTISNISKTGLNTSNIDNRNRSLFTANGLHTKLKSLVDNIIKFDKNQTFSSRGFLACRQWAASFYKKLKELQDRCALLQKEIESSKSGKILEKRTQNRGIWRFLGVFKVGKEKNYQKVSTAKADDSEKVSDGNDEKEKKKEKTEGPEKPKDSENDTQNCEPTINEMLKKIKNFKRDIRYYLAQAETTDNEQRLGKLERAVWHLTVLLNKWKQYFTVKRTPNDCRAELISILEKCIKKIIDICDANNKNITLKNNSTGWQDYNPSDIERNRDAMEKFHENWKALKTTSSLLHSVKNNAGAYALTGLIVGVSKMLLPAGLLGKAWEIGKSLFGRAGIKTEL